MCINIFIYIHVNYCDNFSLMLSHRVTRDQLVGIKVDKLNWTVEEDCQAPPPSLSFGVRQVYCLNGIDKERVN